MLSKQAQGIDGKDAQGLWLPELPQQAVNLLATHVRSNPSSLESGYTNLCIYLSH